MYSVHINCQLTLLNTFNSQLNGDDRKMLTVFQIIHIIHVTNFSQYIKFNREFKRCNILSFSNSIINKLYDEFHHSYRRIAYYDT